MCITQTPDNKLKKLKGLNTQDDVNNTPQLSFFNQSYDKQGQAGT